MVITEEKYNEGLTRYVLPFIRLNFEDGYMKSADGTRIHYGYVTTSKHRGFGTFCPEVPAERRNYA